MAAVEEASPTFEEFLEVLEGMDFKWRKKQGRHIRTDVSTCPICAVARGERGGWDAWAGGRELGLSAEVRERIVDAADGNPWTNPADRRALLRACGLRR